jgi:hypothetical protein
MKFSQRKGLISVRDIVQKDYIDENLQNKLWNLFYCEIALKINNNLKFNFHRSIWTDFFNNKIDEFEQFNFIQKIIKPWFFSCEWFEIYDFIEFIASKKKELLFDVRIAGRDSINFITEINLALEKEMSAYRLLGFKIIEITDENELNSIELSFKEGDKFKNVSIHLKSALVYLSNRKNPDYRNSIKESISAVESICRIVTGEKTLGKALYKLESLGVKIHQQIKNAFEKLYLFTNDKQTGIRHALIDEAYNPDFDEAKFMLVTCSAFINYLKSKSI